MTLPTELSTHAAVAELEAAFHSLRASGRNDGAWCIAHAAQVILGDRANVDMRRFADKYRSVRPRVGSVPIVPAAWLELLYHPDDDPYVGKVFESALAPLRLAHAKTLDAFGLTVRDAVTPATSSVALVRALGAAARTLAVPLPLLFLRPDQAGGFAHLASEPIASAAGSGALSGRSISELAFLSGYHMTLYRADHYVRVIYDDPGELAALFIAICRIGKPDLPIPDTLAHTVEDLGEILYADPRIVDLVRRVVRMFVSRGRPADIAAWVRGVEHTALRAGLLLSGDLETARTITGMLTNIPSGAFADLTRFAVSEEYFALRQKTGIALWHDHVAPTMLPPSPTDAAFDSDLRSVEIPLDDLAPPDDSFGGPSGSIDVAIGEVEDVRGVVEEARSVFARAMRENMSERAYCAAVVWHAFVPDALDLDARELLDARRPLDVWPATARLSARDWGAIVRDPGEFGPLAAAIERLAPAIRVAVPRTPEDYGFASDVSAPDEDVAATFAAATRLLGVPSPSTFVVSDPAHPVTSPPCTPAIVLVDAAWYADLSQTERAFVAAEQVAWLRPDRSACRLIPSASQLSAVVLAAVAAVARGDVGSTAGTARKVAEALLASAPMRDDASGVFSAVAAGSVERDVVEYWRACERTAARAALFAVFDLSAARTTSARPRAIPPLVSVDAKLLALASFALSHDFADARKRTRDGT